MARNADARLAPGAAVRLDELTAATDSATLSSRQPREIHDPIPTDKIALFELPRVYLIAGIWQGPGSIATLRRRVVP
jgi:hypothetical protein